MCIQNACVDTVNSNEKIKWWSLKDGNLANIERCNSSLGSMVRWITKETHMANNVLWNPNHVPKYISSSSSSSLDFITINPQHCPILYELQHVTN